MTSPVAAPFPCFTSDFVRDVILRDAQLFSQRLDLLLDLLGRLQGDVHLQQHGDVAPASPPSVRQAAATDEQRVPWSRTGRDDDAQ